MSLTPEGYAEVRANLDDVNVDSLRESFERYRVDRNTTLMKIVDDFPENEKEICKNLKKVHKLANKMTFVLKQLHIVNNDVYFELLKNELQALHGIKEVLIKKTTNTTKNTGIALFASVSKEIYECELALNVSEQGPDKAKQNPKDYLKNCTYLTSLKSNRRDSVDEKFLQNFDSTSTNYFQNLNSTLEKFKDRYNRLCPGDKKADNPHSSQIKANKNVICFDDVYCESSSNSDSKLNSLADSSSEEDRFDSYIEPENVGRFLNKVKKLKEQKIIFKVVDYRYVCSETREIIYQDPLNKYINSDSSPRSMEANSVKPLPNGFYQYCVKIHGRSIRPFNIWRRYNSFLKLHSDLSTRHKHIFQLNFPEKKMFGNKSESFVKFRLVLLNEYMCNVAKIISKNKVLLLDFLNGLTDDSDIVLFLKKLHPFFTSDK